jgi:peptidoglycan/xylan/chitin deacetylase (PgdA/CDA1 family)
MATPINPAGKVKLAVTVDDLLMWKGMPWAPGYNAPSVTATFLEAFKRNGVRGVYAFSSTAPANDQPELLRVFDAWSDKGHLIANHTHYHANLNWIDEDRYIRDIEETEEIIDKWSQLAPVKYFRYAMDNWGDTQRKYDAVDAYLKRTGYTQAPVSVWFYDTEFLIAHLRATMRGDQQALAWLRERYVQTALQQLRAHAAAARIVFGRDPVYIWLIHGTPIAADCLNTILEEFQAAGVEFVGLDEAMADPINRDHAPMITPRFLNHIMKWAELKKVPIEDCPPAILKEMDLVVPIDGLSAAEVMTKVFKGLSDEVGGRFFPKMY